MSMKRKSSVALVVLASTGTHGFRAALVTSANPSRGQLCGSSASRLHDQKSYGSDYENYYHRNDVQPQPFGVPAYEESSSYYRGDQELSPQRKLADVDTNNYSQDINRTIGKSKGKSNNAMDIFSQMFPKQPKNQVTNSPTSPRVQLPDLHDMFSEEDMQKFTSQAISGGKFVSSLIGEVIFNTAKMAIGALDGNKTQAMEATSYEDVCDFDDELCREIEDALAATESFKVLNEKSREKSATLDIQAAAERMNQELPVSYSGADTPEHAGSNDVSRPQVDSSSAMPSRDYYFASREGSRDYEDYYKRTLEQQLLEVNQSKSNNAMHDASETPLYKIPIEPTKLRRPKLDADSLLNKSTRIDRNDPISKQSQRASMGDPLRHADEYPMHLDVRLSDSSRDTKVPVPKDVRKRKLGFSDEDYMNMPFDNPQPEPARDHRQNLGSQNQYKMPDMVKMHITDEALAFARSLNLDVYEIFQSTRNPRSAFANESEGVMGEDVVTLDDVVWYCDKMQIGPKHRSLERRDQFSSGEVGNNRTRENQLREQTRVTSRVERRTRLDQSYFGTDDNFARGRERRRPNIVPEMRHQYEQVIQRVPRFNPRDYSKPSRLTSKPKPVTEDRLPRFKQYPTDRRPERQRPEVRRDFRAPNPHTIRRTNQIPSPMSQLIGYQPNQDVQYNAMARGNSGKSRMSTVSLAKLIQGPREGEVGQVSTNTFREPYQEGKNSNNRPPAMQSRSRNQFQDLRPKMKAAATTSRQYSQPSLRELSQRYEEPLVSSIKQEQSNSEYYTNDALELAGKYGVDLKNVSVPSDSDEPISAEDVKNYIESRMSIRASGNGLSSQRDPQYIDNEMTYEQFASYFNSDEETTSKSRAREDHTKT